MTDEKAGDGIPRTLTGLTAAFDPATLVGEVLAERYRIISLIDHGGMGFVFKAQHDLMDRTVAIKLLKPQLLMDPNLVKRFQVEAKAASRLSHPNIITIHDFGVTGAGLPYLVMDFLSGISLAKAIRLDGQIEPARAVKIFMQVCEALEHAHNHGIVHRDLKPGNIMLVESDRQKDMVKVVDFGVAKVIGPSAEGQSLTQSGEIFGSPIYMSPEQCLGEPLDGRSDIYSLGVVMYEALTGVVPFQGKDVIQTIMLHKTEMPRPFSQVRPDLFIPERLQSVVLNALAKEADARHQSMAELGEDLRLSIPPPGRKSAQPPPGRQRPPSPPLLAESQPAPGRSPLYLAVLAAAAMIIGAALFAVLLLNQKRAPSAVTPSAVSAPRRPSAPAAAPASAPKAQAAARRDPHPAKAPATAPRLPARKKPAPGRQAPAAPAEPAYEPLPPEPAPVHHGDAAGSWYSFQDRERQD